MKEFKGVIYRATNQINGKVYIGQTTAGIEKRKFAHKRSAFISNSQLFFHRAIRKYGFYAFCWETIEVCNEEKILFEREIYWIALYNSTNPEKGYNMSEGGFNPRLKGELNPNFGGLKDGVAEKISKTLTGKPGASKGSKRTPEQNERNRVTHTGKKFSKEVNKKKGKPQYGDKNPMFGKKGELHHAYQIPRSDETKRRISKTLNLNESCKGEKNGNAKTYRIIFTDDSEIVVKSLKTWCIDNNIIQHKLIYALRNSKVLYNIKNITKI